MKRKTDDFDQYDDKDHYHRGAWASFIHGPVSMGRSNLPCITRYIRIPPGPDVINDRLCCGCVDGPNVPDDWFDSLVENVWSKTHLRVVVARLGQKKALASDCHAMTTEFDPWIWITRRDNSVQPAKIKEVLGDNLSVAHMTFSSNGLYLLVRTTDGAISIWKNSCASITCVDKELKHQTWNIAVAVSNNGIYFTISMVDSVIEVHNRQTKTKQELKGHKAGVLCTAFSEDATYLISGSLDCTVKLWDLGSRVCIRSLCLPGVSPERVVLSPCNRFAAVWYPYGCVVIWECSTGNVIERILLDEFVISMAWAIHDGLLIRDVPSVNRTSDGVVGPREWPYKRHNIYCAFKTWKTPRWSLYSAILAGITNYVESRSNVGSVKLGPWELFLMRGLYDPRLFMLIGAFGCNYLYDPH